MKYFKTPKFLVEVFGEQQSTFEVICTALFAILGTTLVYFVSAKSLDSWQAWLAFILIADVLAGCIANFSFGTNAYYAQKPKSRLTFIAIHVHILVIAWLLAEPINKALIVWSYTIVAALVVNHLHGKSMQGFVAANLMCYGLLLLVYLSLPMWFLMVSMFFMIKVMYSFSVDHYKTH